MPEVENLDESKTKLLGNQEGNFDSLLSQRDRETTSRVDRKTNQDAGQEERQTTMIGRYMTVANSKGN